ncbi:hypothetical protein [Streptomyces sp. NBC_00078]|uniref:TRADD-N-associated membrane domain-containing protein n=1 Tax=unclassified Streptomyces TaxID=2593676 RepID=UPI002250831C|nr:hypothetical protein [Streptomyces sp. NBC_00078]MCX5419941.1 hypothetical protein [Streptomyces sp. NBC_00078]
MADDETSSAEAMQASADEAAGIRQELRRIDERLQRQQALFDDPSLTVDEREHVEREMHSLTGMQERLVSRLSFTDYVSAQSIVVTGGSHAVFNTGHVVAENQGLVFEQQGSERGAKSSTVADKRAEFVFGALQEERTQANFAYWLSLGVAAVAAVIALAAAVLALFHGSGQGAKWVTSIISTAVAIAGGAWHRQARQARDKVSEHVKRVEAQVNADDQFEKASWLVEQVKDPATRDNILGTAALYQFGVPPSSEGTPELLPSPELTDGDHDPGTTT